MVTDCCGWTDSCGYTYIQTAEFFGPSSVGSQLSSADIGWSDAIEIYDLLKRMVVESLSSRQHVAKMAVWNPSLSSVAVFARLKVVAPGLFVSFFLPSSVNRLAVLAANSCTATQELRAAYNQISPLSATLSFPMSAAADPAHLVFIKHSNGNFPINRRFLMSQSSIISDGFSVAIFLMKPEASNRCIPVSLTFPHIANIVTSSFWVGPTSTTTWAHENSSCKYHRPQLNWSDVHHNGLSFGGPTL